MGGRAGKMPRRGAPPRGARSGAEARVCTGPAVPAGRRNRARPRWRDLRRRRGSQSRRSPGSGDETKGKEGGPEVRERETAARVGDRGEEWGPTRRSALARDQCEVGIWNWMRRGGEVIPIIKCQKQFPIQALLIPSLLSNFYRPSIL
jgi:hypothetical protein